MTDDDSKVKFYSKGTKIGEIGFYQSPRGIRKGENRPDIIVIDCHIVCDHLQLLRHIEYLKELYFALDIK
jgi:hypothetical protein